MVKNVWGNGIFPLLFLSIVVCCAGEAGDHNRQGRGFIHPDHTHTKGRTDKPRGASMFRGDTSITKDFLMGRFDYRKHPHFEKVPGPMSSKDIFIQKAALKSFVAMHRAAKKEKINLTIISGTRSFNEQKAIWERKWEKESKKLKNPKDIALKILTFSSMPSTSRHHWGTDIDINSLEPSYFQSGKGMKEFKWLKSNGPKYGFFQVYTSKKNGRTGYSEEPWHWSYLPLAKDFLKTYNAIITLHDIKGFNGAATAKSIDVIKLYVNGIEKYSP